MSGSSTNGNVDELTQGDREGSRSPSPTKNKTVIETRRAEQNRAAQRAFRQRKERYVKELEAKVNSMADWPARMEHLENENESLKRKISELLVQQEQSSKKMFIMDPTPSKNHHHNSEQQSYIKSSHSPSPPPTMTPDNTATTTTTTTTTTTANNTTKVVVGEKGRVLDDLVSILRTRHRPPIPSHPPNQEI